MITFKRKLSWIVFLCMAVSILPARAETLAEQEPVQVLVQYKRGVDTRNKMQTFGLKKNSAVAQLEMVQTDNGNIQLLETPADTVNDLIENLKQNPDIEFVEPNYEIHAFDAPRDAKYAQQWGLKNIGQIINGTAGTAGIDIGVEYAWDKTRGTSSILVAVIDSGIDINHPDLAANIYHNPRETAGDDIDNDQNGFVDDVTGWDFIHNDNSVYDGTTINGENGDQHGTHVAGIIAGISNTVGICGVAPNVKLLPLKALEGREGRLFYALQAIQYAQQAGAQIVNCSWGIAYESKILESVIKESSMLFVCAAGNDGMNNDNSGTYPSNYRLDNLVSVAAVTNTGSLSDFSNYGATAVDIGAPGKQILSTLPENKYGYLDGTSMAAPFVAGTAALLKSAKSEYDAASLAHVIKQTVIPLPSLQGKTVTGGMVSAANAFTAQTDEWVLPSGTYAAGSVVVDDALYTLGGYDGNSYLQTCSKIDPVTNTRSNLENMSIARAFSGVASSEHTLYAIGGWNGTVLSTMETYDLNYPQNGWCSSDLPFCLYGMATTELDNTIYVFGGVGQGGFSNTVYRYHPQTSTWTTVGTLPAACAFASAVVVDERIYLIGGVNDKECLKTVYCYDPRNNVWEECAPFPSARRNAGAALHNGSILLFGGQNDLLLANHTDPVLAGGTVMSGYLSSVYAYDKYKDTWETLPDMDEPRAGFCVYPTSSGLYIGGGWNGNFLNDVRLYTGSVIPQHIQILTNGNQFRIQWDAVNGVSGYQVEVDGTPHDTSNPYLTIPADATPHRIRVRIVQNGQFGMWSDYIEKSVHDSMADAQKLEFGTSVTGVLSTENDVRWYYVAAEQNGALTLEMINIPSGCDYRMALFDGAGELLRYAETEDNRVVFDTISLESDMYYIRVYTLAGFAPETPYALLATFTPAADYVVSDRLKASMVSPAAFSDPNNAGNAKPLSIMSLSDAGEDPDSLLPPSAQPVETATIPKVESACSGTLKEAENEMEDSTIENIQLQAADSVIEVVDEQTSSGIFSSNYTTHTFDFPHIRSIPAGKKGRIIIGFSDKNPDDYAKLEVINNTTYCYWYWIDSYKEAWVDTIVTYDDDTRYTVKVNTQSLGSGNHRYQLTAKLLIGDSKLEGFASRHSLEKEATAIPSIAGIQNTGSYATIKGYLTHRLDTDFYKVPLNAGDKVELNMISPTEKLYMVYISGPGLDKDATCWYLESDSLSLSHMIAPSSGTYYIMVQALNCSVIGSQNYSWTEEYEIQVFYTTRFSGTNDRGYDSYEINDAFEEADEKTNSVFQNASSACQQIELNIDNINDIDRFPIYLNRYDKISMEVLMKTAYNDSIYQYRPFVHTMPSGVSYTEEITDNPGSPRKKYTTFVANKSGYYYIGVRSYAKQWSVEPNARCTLRVTKVSTTNQPQERGPWGDSLITNDFALMRGTFFGIPVEYNTAIQLDGQTDVTGVSLDNELDVDWYRFKPSFSGDGEVSLRNISTAFGQNAEMVLCDSALDVIGTGKDAIQHASFVKGRTYYIGITSSNWNAIKNSTGYDIHIAPVGISQTPEIVFQHVSAGNKDHYYIFDDHPEHIRACDLLDGMYPRRALNHTVELSPGKYTAFSYHHVNKDLFGTPIYFDGVFYNSNGNGGDVKITNIGFSTGSWAAQYVAWNDYLLNNDSYPVMYIEDDPMWLSTVVDRDIPINDQDSDGVAHLIMEFEVTGGTVNFATVAYKNKAEAKALFGPHGDGVESVYENLDTILKGKGHTTQTVQAQEIYYVINDTTSGFLPVRISNDMYSDKQQKVFTTHANIMNENNYASTPSTSVVPLLYQGMGVTRNAEFYETGFVPNRQWVFDTTHTAAVTDISIPENIRGYFGNKAAFSTNEDTKLWLAGIMRNDSNTRKEVMRFLGGDSNPAVVNVPQPYELTYQYVVHVTNAGNEYHNFSYLLQEDQAYVEYYVHGVDGDDRWRQFYPKDNSDNDNQSNASEIFGYWIAPGETITCEINVSMIGGSNPTMHNAFVVDATEYDKTTNLVNLITK